MMGWYVLLGGIVYGVILLGVIELATRVHKSRRV